MKALISPTQNNLVAQVEPDGNIFDVAEPFFWVSCPDQVIPGWTYSDGSFHEPVPVTPEIPHLVSMRQARLALLKSGLLSTVNAAIAAGGEADQITWEYATEVDRNSELVVNLSQALGLSNSDLDNLFMAAAAL